jgi:hypothetical protein
MINRPHRNAALLAQKSGAVGPPPHVAADEPRQATEWRAEITVFQKSGGILSKHLWLNSSTGKPISDGSACLMSTGTARRVEIINVAAFADLINRFGSDEALALGRLKDGLSSKVNVVTADKLNGAFADANTIARTKEYFNFTPDNGGIALFDFDPKGISEAVKRAVNARGNLLGALCAVLPALETTALVIRPSTSSGLYNSRTGERFENSGGRHIFIPVVDAADIPPSCLISMTAAGWPASAGASPQVPAHFSNDRSSTGLAARRNVSSSKGRRSSTRR